MAVGGVGLEEQEESGFNWQGFLSGLLNTGIDYSSMANMQNALAEFGEGARTGMTEIGREAQAGTQFVPFTVTTGTGTATTKAGQPVMDAQGNPVIDPTTGQPMMSGFGGLDVSLTPEQQAMRDTLFGGAGDLAKQATAAYDPMYEQLANQAYGGVGTLLTNAQTAAEAAGSMDRAAREGDVYSRLRAVQSPEEERNRLALENRLRAQGRLGTTTSQFGGTPEGLMLEKAQAEAMNQASLLAMQQAGKEEQQALTRAASLRDLASGMFGMGTTARATPRDLQGMDLQNLSNMMISGYTPDRELLNALQPAINLSSIADAGRRQGAGLFAESAASGLTNELNALLRSAELESDLLSSLTAASGSGSTGGLFEQLLAKLFD